RKLMAVEEIEDPRQSGADIVVAPREWARRRELECAAPERLGVEVDRERHCAPIAPFPHRRWSLLLPRRGIIKPRRRPPASPPPPFSRGARAAATPPPRSPAARAA